MKCAARYRPGQPRVTAHLVTARPICLALTPPLYRAALEAPNYVVFFGMFFYEDAVNCTTGTRLIIVFFLDLYYDSQLSMGMNNCYPFRNMGRGGKLSIHILINID